MAIDVLHFRSNEYLLFIGTEGIGLHIPHSLLSAGRFPQIKQHSRLLTAAQVVLQDAIPLLKAVMYSILLKVKARRALRPKGVVLPNVF